MKYFLLLSTLIFDAASAFISLPKKDEISRSTKLFKTRRDVIQSVFSSTALIISSPGKSIAADSVLPPPNLKNYVHSDQWIGTSLELMSYQQAASMTTATDMTSSYAMGRWPDPILRRPATALPISTIRSRSNEISQIANKLRRTARLNGAVGLAAQQCGIDVSMIFLDDPKHPFSSTKSGLRKVGDIDQGGTFLVNPRITSRSSELDMKVWNEECLVLPPTFRATVLRDALVTVEYENLAGITKETNLNGELARALQHELDHDHGILITDHIGMNELENDDMRKIESVGHEDRQLLAYSRFVSDSSLEDKENLLAEIKNIAVQPANAEPYEYEETSKPVGSYPNGINKAVSPSNNNSTCDEACIQERRRIIQERRAMMQQSRTNRQRSDVLELSKQRAALYGTNYQGVTCPPGIPCI